MLSNRITANSRDAKPANQANDNTVTVIRVLKPAVLLKIPLLRPLPAFAVAVCGILVANNTINYPNNLQQYYFHTSVPTIRFRRKLTFWMTDVRTRLSYK